MELYEQRVISGQIEEVWRVATDVNRWPEWDPHEEAGEIFGAFVEGTRWVIPSHAADRAPIGH
jgi:hypothetical protein